MISTVAWTALLMGLAGGSHCLVMCAAPCAALVGHGAQAVAQGQTTQSVQVLERASKGILLRRTVAFHLGRLVGYAAVGALAAVAMGSLAWLSQHSTVFHPVWTLMHVAILGWGLLMVVSSGQPPWVERAGRAVWAWVSPWVRSQGGLFAVGCLWSMMPCGLLYSALLLAALSGGVGEGALSMVLFGVGSGLWMLSGPWLWTRIKLRLNLVRREWGTRLAGGMLMGVAAWALWMDLIYKPSLWCR
jgi:sulfite exporter TauE/SafE